MGPPMASSMLSRMGLGLLVASLHAQAAVNFDTANGQPWGGTAAEIPGLIEAEHFDTGGEGVGYHDTTAKNVRNAFRTDEGVDIHAHDGGLDVGWNRQGEYLRYTIDVTEDVRAFTFHFRVASLVDTGAFRVVAGGVSCEDYETDLSGLVNVPSTGSYNRYQQYEVSAKGDGGLLAGKTQIWLCAESREFNLDYFTMTAAEDDGGPWKGVPAVVPGTVQAEEFDEGGEGVAYSDSSVGNNKGAFRPDEDVDINAMDDGGFNVGYITAGEFLRYTLDVTKKMDDVYFNFRIASSNGLGSFRIVSGGTGCNDFTKDLSGLVEVPSTGGNTRYQDLAVNGNGTGGLSARETVVWLCVESKSFNIDYFTISKTGVIDPSVPPTPDPYGGVAPPIPGYLQAEEFDFGGEGVGYSDTTDGNTKGVFRPDEDVDIDEIAKGGYNVGYVAAGEYLRYSVDVTNSMSDVYFTFRVASEDGLGSLRVVTGGSDCDDYTTDLSGLVKVPDTGGNNRYQTVEVNGNGDGGIKKNSDAIIWLCIESKSFNLDYFTLSKTSTAPIVPTPGSTVPTEEGGPYGGTAATVPGTVQAEEFDEGGEDVAYSDSSAGNNKGAFRPHEDVDINAMSDGGYNVGYITAGEYLRYTVDVTQSISDVYFKFRIASADGLGSFRMVTGGTDCDDFKTDLSGLVKVPSTGGNLRYQDLAVNGNGTGGLKKGTGTKIWLCAESKSFNIDYFTMSKTAI